jgi:hypothetical protein
MTRFPDIDTFAGAAANRKSNPPCGALLNERLHHLPWRRGENASATAEHIPIHIAHELIRPYPQRQTAKRAICFGFRMQLGGA